ncbi:MAG: hypothetical protein LBK42_13830 [Propionibacteriaceae bacterium]|nr:hypothetical protein [Propionibacteriaceae bacterium]
MLTGDGSGAAGRLAGDLAAVAGLAGLLRPMLTSRTPGQAPKSQPADRLAPIRVGVLDLTAAVNETLAEWAGWISVQGGLAKRERGRVRRGTTADLAGVVSRHLEVVRAAGKADDLAADLGPLWAALRSVVGEGEKLILHSAVGAACDGALVARPGGAVACDKCERVWTAGGYLTAAGLTAALRREFGDRAPSRRTVYDWIAKGDLGAARRDGRGRRAYSLDAARRRWLRGLGRRPATRRHAADLTAPRSSDALLPLQSCPETGRPDRTPEPKTPPDGQPVGGR